LRACAGLCLEGRRKRRRYQRKSENLKTGSVTMSALPVFRAGLGNTVEKKDDKKITSW
jgi:hypothetical protein